MTYFDFANWVVARKPKRFFWRPVLFEKRPKLKKLDASWQVSIVAPYRMRIVGVYEPPVANTLWAMNRYHKFRRRLFVCQHKRVKLFLAEMGYEIR